MNVLTIKAMTTWPFTVKPPKIRRRFMNFLETFLWLLPNSICLFKPLWMERFTSTFDWCYHQHALHHAFRLISWRQLSPVPVCSTFVSRHNGDGWTNDVQRIWTLGSAWNIPNTFQLQSFQVIAIKMCYTTTILPLIPSYRYRPGVWNQCYVTCRDWTD